MTRKRLGFFTRLLDHVAPGERYRLATEQIHFRIRIIIFIPRHRSWRSVSGLPPFPLRARCARLRPDTA